MLLVPGGKIISWFSAKGKDAATMEIIMLK